MNKHLALYQKYRPTKFKEVYGQEHNIKILKNSILNHKIQNGYIFCGQYGTGKTSLARIFGAAINCKGFAKNLDVDDNCFACKAITKGHPDLIEIDAASNSGIDSIRALREETQIAPLEFSRKVYIIDEAHMLSAAAWDGMLKILEDPELKVTFIFATTNVNKIPKTINSRCIELRFNALNDIVMMEWLQNILKKEGITYHKNALKIILIAARGSFRDVLTILDKKSLLAEGKELTEEIASKITFSPSVKDIQIWIKALIDNNFEKTLFLLENFSKSESDPIVIAELTIFCLIELIEKNIKKSILLKYANLLNVFFTFLKDKRVMFNPTISLKVSILNYLFMNQNKKIINQVPIIKNEDTFDEQEKVFSKSDFSITINKNKPSKISKNNQSFKFENSLDNQEEILDTTDEIEQTIELGDDTIDLDMSGELDDDQLDSNIQEMVIKKISLEEQINLRIQKIPEFLWEEIVNNAKEPSALYPISWNLSPDDLISLWYRKYHTSDREFIEISNKWNDIHRMLQNNENLPFSALLYDGQPIILVKNINILVVQYDIPIRAALFNRICRTKLFLKFVKKLFGKEFWIIAITKRELIKLRNDYQSIQQINPNKLAEYKFPKIPNIIEKIHRPTHKAHVALLEKLKSDPYLNTYEIKLEY